MLVLCQNVSACVRMCHSALTLSTICVSECVTVQWHYPPSVCQNVSQCTDIILHLCVRMCDSALTLSTICVSECVTVYWHYPPSVCQNVSQCTDIIHHLCVRMCHIALTLSTICVSECVTVHWQYPPSAVSLSCHYKNKKIKSKNKVLVNHKADIIIYMENGTHFAGKIKKTDRSY
jgi:PhoPQ-activated pathogenicity-related protein